MAAPSEALIIAHFERHGHGFGQWLLASPTEGLAEQSLPLKFCCRQAARTESGSSVVATQAATADWNWSVAVAGKATPVVLPPVPRSFCDRSCCCSPRAPEVTAAPIARWRKIKACFGKSAADLKKLKENLVAKADKKRASCGRCSWRPRGRSNPPLAWLRPGSLRQKSKPCWSERASSRAGSGPALPFGSARSLAARSPLLLT